MNASFSSMLNQLNRTVEMNNTGVIGLFEPPKSDFEHARSRNSAYAFFGHDRHTDIYISREISIEHPNVGLASLAQLVSENRRCSDS